jgi:uncharacterized protein YdaU (DUF1376 family)
MLMIGFLVNSREADEMAQHPMMPFWTDAYLGDTHHLKTIEHGAYFLLLIAAWRSKEGVLPDDDQKLARYAGLTLDKWKKIRPVLETFFCIDNGVWEQGRLTDERNASLAFRKSQSKKAKDRHLKNKDLTQPAASSGHMPTLNPSPSTLIEDTYVSSIPPISPNKTEILMHFENIWKSYPGRGRDGATGAAYKGSKKSAQEKFFTIYKNTKEIDREALVGNIIRACGEYAAFLEHADYPSKQLSTWLNAAGWETDYSVEAGSKECTYIDRGDQDSKLRDRVNATARLVDHLLGGKIN